MLAACGSPFRLELAQDVAPSSSATASASTSTPNDPDAGDVAHQDAATDPDDARDVADAGGATQDTSPPEHDAGPVDAGDDVVLEHDAAADHAAPIEACAEPAVQMEIPVNGVVYGTLPLPTACYCAPDCACLLEQPLCGTTGMQPPSSCTGGSPIVVQCAQ